MSDICGIGVDLGGSKIEALVLAADGTELVRRRAPTPAGDYRATVTAVAELVAMVETEADLESGPHPVGVGIPGTVSPATGLVKNANSTCLIGEPLDRDLTDAMGRPVRLANDADLFAASEAVDGAGAGQPVVFGVILGTGVGGGIAIDGRAATGPNRVRGEWGHNPLPWPRLVDGTDERPGPECYCGKSGCIETFVSGPGLAADHRRHGGEDLSAEDVATRASAGDETAMATLERYQDRLARALAHAINVLDPDVIVLGGGLSNLDTIYARVPELWQAWVFSDVCTTPLKRNLHGDSSGVRGAARLWID